MRYIEPQSATQRGLRSATCKWRELQGATRRGKGLQGAACGEGAAGCAVVAAKCNGWGLRSVTRWWGIACSKMEGAMWCTVVAAECSMGGVGCREQCEGRGVAKCNGVVGGCEGGDYGEQRGVVGDCGVWGGGGLHGAGGGSREQREGRGDAECNGMVGGCGVHGGGY